MKYLFTLICLLGILTAEMAAQDQNFTQFYGSPLTLNPALTGAFNGKFRVGGIYRDQWQGALDQPYRTFSASVDVRFDLELNSRYKDAFAAGLYFYTDKVGIIDFSTNVMGVSAAFHKGLDWDKKQFLSLGFQAGLGQRNVNYSTLTFEDEFNGLNAFEFATAENLPANNFSFGDFAVGLNYTFNPKDRTALFIGASLYHINSPRIAFTEEPEPEEGIDEGVGVRLHRKYSAQISAEFPLAKKKRISLLPRVVVYSQGPHLTMNAGTNLRFFFSDYSPVALQIGSWARTVKDFDESYRLDAIVGLLGLEIDGFFLGFSYDASMTEVQTFRNQQGVFEISMSYIGAFENEEILCPTF